MTWQPLGLKTRNADLREKDMLALKVNMLIRNNLQFINGLSKMLIPRARHFEHNMLITNNSQFIHALSPTNSYGRSF
jgi:hypothetical protein